MKILYNSVKYCKGHVRLSLISPGSNIESHSEMKMKDTSLNEIYFNFKVFLTVFKSIKTIHQIYRYIGASNVVQHLRQAFLHFRLILLLLRQNVANLAHFLSDQMFPHPARQDIQQEYLQKGFAQSPLISTLRHWILDLLFLHFSTRKQIYIKAFNVRFIFF